MHILVATQDRVSRIFLSEILVRANHRVFPVGSSCDLLNEIQTTSSSLVISDCQIPGLSGPQLCEAIKGVEQGKVNYLLMLVDPNAAQQIPQLLEAGVDDYLMKPFDSHELLMRIQIGERIARSRVRELALVSLLKLIESRSHETTDHFYRVGVYSTLLAQELATTPVLQDQINEEFLDNIGRASWLHDIGKISVPDSILTKPGKLTREEMSIVQSHSTVGADAFRATIEALYPDPFLVMAKEIAESHHEKFNGTGYPDQLAGESIPLAARIVALADAYDAITSKRPYQNNYSHETARNRIESDSGSHFDPRIVEVFLALDRQFKAICEEFATEHSPVIEMINRAAPANGSYPFSAREKMYASEIFLLEHYCGDS